MLYLKKMKISKKDFESSCWCQHEDLDFSLHNFFGFVRVESMNGPSGDHSRNTA
jgi:hypothetical protein